jgi:hypothetical protein
VHSRGLATFFLRRIFVLSSNVQTKKVPDLLGVMCDTIEFAARPLDTATDVAGTAAIQ